MDHRLHDLPFFRRCPDSEFERLSALIEIRRIDRLQRLYVSGQYAPAFFLLKTGRLKKVEGTSDRWSDGGDEILEPGALFGFSALLGVPHHATVEAIEPSEVIAFPMDRLRSHRTELPWIWDRMEDARFKAAHRDQILGWLRHTALFRNLPPREVERALEAMELKKYKPGATVIRQSERGASMGLIVRGEARMVQDPGGGRQVEIAALTEGDLFGESGLLPECIREAGVIAITPLTVLTLYRDAFETIAESAPYLRRTLSAMAAERLSGALDARAAALSKGIAVLIVSRVAGLGRSSLTIQLGASMAREGLAIALVDAVAPWQQTALAQRLRIPVLHDAEANMPRPGRRIGRWRTLEVFQLDAAEPDALSELSRWMDELKSSFDVILIDAPAFETSDANRTRVLADSSEWIVHLTTHPTISDLPFDTRSRQVIRVVPERGRMGELPYIGRDIHRLPWDEEAARDFRQTGIPWILSAPEAPSSRVIRRLKRLLLRRQVGIALAGGGNWGFSHVGVLQVLNENRVAVDMLSGTSAGAVIGGLFSMGMTGRDIEDHFRHAALPALLKILRPSHLIGGAPMRSQAFERFTQELYRGMDCTALAIPFWPSAMDADSGEDVVFRRGAVHQAVCAAAAIPGLFAPFLHEGRVLVDGGFVNNLPLGTLYEMGCNISIGVNCIPHLQPATRPMLKGERPRRRFDGWQVRHAGTRVRKRDVALRLALTPLMAPLSAMTTMNMVNRGFQMLCHRIGDELGRLADIYIVPDVGHASWFEIHRLQEMIDAGRRGAEESLDRILEICPRDE